MESLADIFRLVLIVSFGLSLGLTYFTIVYYGRRRKLMARTLDPNPPVGLLPWHVLAVSISHLALMFSAILANIERIGQGFTVYIPLNGVGFGLTLIALWIIFHYERTMLREAERKDST